MEADVHVVVYVWVVFLKWVFFTENVALQFVWLWLYYTIPIIIIIPNWLYDTWLLHALERLDILINRVVVPESERWKS